MMLKENIGETIRRLREASGMTQADLADKIGTDKGNVSRMEKKGQGTLERLSDTADALGVRLSELILIVEDEAHHSKDLIGYTTTPSLADSLSIPLINASGSMGDGYDQPECDIVVDVLRLKKDWISENVKPLSSPRNLSFIHALGDSMAPTLTSGDILLVDTGMRTALIDGVYVLEAHNRLFIKRVRQRMDGAYEITSDNPTVKTVDVLNGDHQVDILGRVVWAWNGRRL
ncbi:MAG: helix-turn-helix domain-containing protein [Gammaproteobacteria bacterium]|nr:helix-turn-helix domain-containing protein [Gammaproteobacteria bacterium]MBU1732263.1 helix-turn-helix domain-containing protein [Gammaproteobacteria bacterium]MBU1893833.1 helix-turn-helix domain-containing protein [Gammaproteobacteria bacterium]